MTSHQQRAELQRRIWQIANDVRGAVDGWDFKQYVLGTLFYRFIIPRLARGMTNNPVMLRKVAASRNHPRSMHPLSSPVMLREVAASRKC